jgi:hypothetical protein
MTGWAHPITGVPPPSTNRNIKHTLSPFHSHDHVSQTGGMGGICPHKDCTPASHQNCRFNFGCVTTRHGRSFCPACYMVAYECIGQHTHSIKGWCHPPRGGLPGSGNLRGWLRRLVTCGGLETVGGLALVGGLCAVFSGLFGIIVLNSNGWLFFVISESGGVIAAVGLIILVLNEQR